jgi:hypothetical protein
MKYINRRRRMYGGGVGPRAMVQTNKQERMSAWRKRHVKIVPKRGKYSAEKQDSAW